MIVIKRIAMLIAACVAVSLAAVTPLAFRCGATMLGALIAACAAVLSLIAAAMYRAIRQRHALDTEFAAIIATEYAAVPNLDRELEYVLTHNGATPPEWMVTTNYGASTHTRSKHTREILRSLWSRYCYQLRHRKSFTMIVLALGGISMAVPLWVAVVTQNGLAMILAAGLCVGFSLRWIIVRRI